jgi:hypothetical protein
MYKRWLLTIGLLTTVAAAQSGAPQPMSSMQWLQGKWSCDGHFLRSGKSISADVSFESSLDGKLLLFRHDDRPPFSYHALSEWGYSTSAKRFVSTIQDSAGGFRYFESDGWRDGHLVWEGDAIKPEKPTLQRFRFNKNSDNEFRAIYYVQHDGQWTDIDTSICKRLH